MININLDVKGIVQATDRMDKVIEEVPRALKTDAYELAKKISIRIKANARRKNLNWKGHLMRAIQARHSSNGAMVTTPRSHPMGTGGQGFYAEYLEHMQPHYVSIEHPEIQAWLNSSRPSIRGSSGMGHSGGYRGMIRVRPHPFMRNPIRQELAKARTHFANGNAMRKINGIFAG